MDDLATKIIIVIVSMVIGIFIGMEKPDKDQDNVPIRLNNNERGNTMKDEYFLTIEHYMDGKKTGVDRADLNKDEYILLFKYLLDNVHSCNLSSDEIIKEEHKRLERCRDCVCLAAGDDGEWICDEAEENCTQVKYCPEGF